MLKQPQCTTDVLKRTSKTRQMVALECRGMVRKLLGNNKKHKLDFDKDYGFCLFLALAVSAWFTKRGLRTLLQVGDMNWPIRKQEEDDGKSPTHLSFEVDPKSLHTIMALAASALPECHCWAGVPSSNEMIDLSTFELPRHVEENGLIWTADPPPDYLWSCGDKEFPEGVRYAVDPELTMYIHQKTRKLYWNLCDLAGGY